jgi:hypothetical protein
MFDGPTTLRMEYPCCARHPKFNDFSLIRIRPLTGHASPQAPARLNDMPCSNEVQVLVIALVSNEERSATRSTGFRVFKSNDYPRDLLVERLIGDTARFTGPRRLGSNGTRYEEKDKDDDLTNVILHLFSADSTLLSKKFQALKSLQIGGT